MHQNNSEVERIDRHVEILGWLSIVYGAFGMLIGMGFVLFFGGLAALVPQDEPGGAVALGIIAFIVGGVIIVLSIPSIIVGYGLTKRMAWARIGGIILGVLHLLDIPLGLALGIYSLWVLLNNHAPAVFRPQTHSQ